MYNRILFLANFFLGKVPMFWVDKTDKNIASFSGRFFNLLTFSSDAINRGLKPNSDQRPPAACQYSFCFYEAIYVQSMNF